MVCNSKLYFLITWTLIVLFSVETLAKQKSLPSAPDKYDDAIRELETLVFGISSEGDEEMDEEKETDEESEVPEGRSFGAKVAARSLPTNFAETVTTVEAGQGNGSVTQKKIKGRSLGVSKVRVTERVASYGIYG